MKMLFVVLMLAGPVFAHLGEEKTGAEQHSFLDILLDSQSAIIVSAIIFAAVVYVFYTLFPMKKADRNKFFIIAGLIGLVFIFLLFLSFIRPPPSPKPYHTHADFKVYLEGAPYNFSQPKYMSTDESRLSDIVHLHDMDGDVIHHHARNVTLADFFGSLDIMFNSTCFVLDDGASYCNSDDKILRMFVRHEGGEWESNTEMENYVFADLDQILITYGTIGERTTNQKASVTDKACIQSEKCPERGEPTDSSCAGDVCIVG
jgi:hypothetical protein